MNPSGWALLIVVDTLVVLIPSLIVGGWAPRWPSTWLQVDRGPLRLHGFETRDLYRHHGIARLARILPEGGAAFGGQSKKQLPGVTAVDLSGYLEEVRRAEWVHWWSLITWLPLVFFNPWWLGLAFALVVLIVNLIFIIVLRFNRMRLLSILARLGT